MTKPSPVERWERSVDVPLLMFAVASIPLIVVEDTVGGVVGRGAVVANWVIWGLFVADLVVCVARS